MLLISFAVLIFVVWLVAFVFFRVVGVGIHILLAIAILILVLALGARHGRGPFGRRHVMRAELVTPV
jgi:hypothetical protein